MSFKVLTLIILLINFYECAPSRLDKLATEILNSISQYLELPHSQLSLVNIELNRFFKDELSYKTFLSYRLDIAELKELPDGYEAELLPIGSLGRFNDPNHVFKAIKNDLFKLKRFPTAGRQLARYLYRYYHMKDQKIRLILDPSGTFYDDLNTFLTDNNHFDLLIEFKMEEPLRLFNGLLSFGHARSFFDHVSINDIVRSFYISCLAKTSAKYLYKALKDNLNPKSTEIFDITLNIIRQRISYDLNLLDSESLVQFCRSLELFQDIRDIQISTNYYNDFIKPKITDSSQVFDLMVISSIIDKKDLFRELAQEEGILTALNLYLNSLLEASIVLKPGDVKIFFEYYAVFNDNPLFNSQFLIIIMKFYAFKSIENIQNGALLIVFKAPNYLVSLGFPDQIEIRNQGQIGNFLSTIWDEMVVDDLETFKEFFKCYLRLKPATTLAIFVDANVAKLFLRDQELVNLVQEARLKLVLGNGNEDLLLSEDALPGFSRILIVTNKLNFIKIANDLHEIKRAESLCNSRVSEIILEQYSYDELLDLTEEDFFELRGALKFWATQTDSVHAISRIESPIVLKLLAKELA